VERRDVIIVGGGPAGAATALFPAATSRRSPRAFSSSRRRAPAPEGLRGGLIPHTLDCLDELGVGLTVPHVMVDRARVEVPASASRSTARASARSCGANEFDASLLERGAGARRRGARGREGRGARRA
jgi:2-polyprenyl-6-methoxyphenol hydroxylase-like FAD-dependent oxidoreductase